MSSPFESVANADLVFQIQTNSLTTDGWGNPVPSQQDFTIQALLQPAKQPTIERWGGADASIALFEGFLVNPLELPIEIRPPCTGQGTIVVATNRKEKGDIKLLPIFQNPYVVAAGVKEVTRIVVSFRSREVISE
jgi:hypothetical protein